MGPLASGGWALCAPAGVSISQRPGEKRKTLVLSVSVSGLTLLYRPAVPTSFIITDLCSLARSLALTLSLLQANEVKSLKERKEKKEMDGDRVRGGQERTMSCRCSPTLKTSNTQTHTHTDSPTPFCGLSCCSKNRFNPFTI